METAGDALGILCDDAPQDQETEQVVRDSVVAFRELAGRYFSLVNVRSKKKRNRFEIMILI